MYDAEDDAELRTRFARILLEEAPTARVPAQWTQRVAAALAAARGGETRGRVLDLARNLAIGGDAYFARLRAQLPQATAAARLVYPPAEYARRSPGAR